MMNTNLIIGLVAVLIVGFFAFQWWSASGRRRGGRAVMAAAAPAPKPTAAVAEPVEGPAVPVAPAPERMPVVPGQTEADLRAKEPPQERRVGGTATPVTAAGQGPAAVDDNLRHPEALFHQPAAAAPGASVPASDIAAGRASAVSTTGVAGGSQGFGPEMAQNGGAIVGQSVFAFDGMEPTGFASF